MAHEGLDLTACWWDPEAAFSLRKRWSTVAMAYGYESGKSGGFVPSSILYLSGVLGPDTDCSQRTFLKLALCFDNPRLFLE